MSGKFYNRDSIYFFRYKNPAGKGRLGVWDSAPLVIPLDVTSKSLLAINIHWIPKRYRKVFLDFLFDYFKKRKVGSKRFSRVKLYYNLVKHGKVHWALVAVRRYHISRITRLQEIKRDHWSKLLEDKKYRGKFYYDSTFKQLTRMFRRPPVQ